MACDFLPPVLSCMMSRATTALPHRETYNRASTTCRRIRYQPYGTPSSALSDHSHAFPAPFTTHVSFYSYCIYRVKMGPNCSADRINSERQSSETVLTLNALIDVNKTVTCSSAGQVTSQPLDWLHSGHAHIKAN